LIAVLGAQKMLVTCVPLEVSVALSAVRLLPVSSEDADVAPVDVMSVGVDVRVGVLVGGAVAVKVAVCVNVCVGAGVAVNVGELAGTAVWVPAAGVAFEVGVAVRVLVAAPFTVDVGDGVAVGVSVAAAGGYATTSLIPGGKAGFVIDSI
jgi:hypothetical protein